MTVKHYDRNTAGKDYVIGDIHGHFRKVQQQLDEMGFNPDTDRLFSVGDLVDRGPDSEMVLEWLEYPWFHPVQGNHEDMAIRWPNGTREAGNYYRNGGAWNIANPESLQREIAESLTVLPIGIEVDTKDGLIGIVHAECPGDDWVTFRDVMNSDASNATKKRLKETALWARLRISSGLDHDVLGVHKLYVGHTPLRAPVQLGNVHYIDTAGWHGGVFTIVEL